MSVLIAATNGYTQQQPDLATIVTRLEQAQDHNRESSRPYTITREYRFYGSDEQHPKSSVVADVSFMPPDEKSFTIEKSEGSDRGAKIVKSLLESEAEAARKQTPSIDRQNYDFSLVGPDSFQGARCWVLRIQPKREAKDLINGQVWVDQATYRIYRIDGDLAKSPSWWLKKVHVTIDFGNAAGMWLQTNTRAVADVRMLGKHTFTGEAVRIRTADELASAKLPAPANSLRASDNLISGPVAPPPLARTQAAVKRRPQRPVPPVLGAGILTR